MSQVLPGDLDKMVDVRLDFLSMAHHIYRIIEMPPGGTVNELDIQRLHEALDFVYDQIDVKSGGLPESLVEALNEPRYKYGSSFAEKFGQLLEANETLQRMKDVRADAAGKMLGLMVNVAEYAAGLKSNPERGVAPLVGLRVLKDCIGELGMRA